MAGVEGFEPSRKLLESFMLPLHHTPSAPFSAAGESAAPYSPDSQRMYYIKLTNWCQQYTVKTIRKSRFFCEKPLLPNTHRSKAGDHFFACL
jgi:hypothetical protein